MLNIILPVAALMNMTFLVLLVTSNDMTSVFLKLRGAGADANHVAACLQAVSLGIVVVILAAAFARSYSCKCRSCPSRSSSSFVAFGSSWLFVRCYWV